MQRDRTSKYLWSVRGFLPGRQRLRCSLANVHSQGARWLIRSSGIRTMKMAPLRRLTFEFTRSRKRAKPAIASRVQRRVRPHGCSEALGRVACPKFMAMKKVDAERTSSFASGCDLAGQLSGSYPNSRSSCEQRQALAIFAAHWTAASRDGSSRTQKPPSNSLVCG